VRGVGYIWRDVGGVVGVVRVGEWRLGAGSRHAGTGLLDARRRRTPRQRNREACTGGKLQGRRQRVKGKVRLFKVVA